MVRILTILTAAAASCAGVFAQASGSLPALVAQAGAAEPAALEFRQLRIDGREVYGAVRDVVRSLDWHTRLRGAQATAAAAGGKPIVWIHALGDLKGFT